MMSSAQEYDGPVAKYTNPLTGQVRYSTSIRSYSEEKLISGNRFGLKMHVYRMIDGGVEKYLLRSIIRNSPEEWPLGTTAYLMVDDLRFPIELVHITPRTTTTVSASGMDGDTNVSSTESQFFRVESELPFEAVNSVTLTSQISFIIYSGIFPVTFKIGKGEVYNFVKQRDLRLN